MIVEIYESELKLREFYVLLVFFLNRSATEEQSDEKEQLLIQIRDMAWEFKIKTSTKSKESIEVEEIDIKPTILQPVNVEDEAEVAVVEQRRAVKRPYSQKNLQFLREKQQNERNIKLRELQLEEKKVALEERKVALQERQIKLEEEKFQMEKMYKEQKLQIDVEERKRAVEAQKQNYTLINVLLQMVQEKHNLH